MNTYNQEPGRLIEAVKCKIINSPTTISSTLYNLETQYYYDDKNRNHEYDLLRYFLEIENKRKIARRIPLIVLLSLAFALIYFI